jgi:hypothetical protein
MSLKRMIYESQRTEVAVYLGPKPETEAKRDFSL